MVTNEQTTELNRFNILSGLISSRAENTQQLRQLNLSSEVINSFARLAGLVDCGTVDQYADGTQRLLFNPVNGLVREEIARPFILKAITSEVINGEKEIAVLETDMNNLKGINDEYGTKGGDEAIRKYADSTQQSLLEAIASSGDDIKFAVVNKHGEGSDSIKIILIGKDLYKFARKYVDQRNISSVTVKLQRKIDREQEETKIDGGWGFYVLTRDELHRFQTMPGSDLEKAGELYQFTSDFASILLEPEKARREAEIANKILSAESIDDLLSLETEISQLGSRVADIIHKHLFKRLRELKEKSNA